MSLQHDSSVKERHDGELKEPNSDPGKERVSSLQHFMRRQIYDHIVKVHTIFFLPETSGAWRWSFTLIYN
jgi:hypothetical protein